MAEITKEDLLLMAEIQSKVATQMENIANSLRTITDTQRDINSRIHDGMTKDIGDSVEKSIKSNLSICNTTCTGLKEIVGKVRDDTFWIKIILGSIALIVTLSVAIQQFIHWVNNNAVVGIVGK